MTNASHPSQPTLTNSLSDSGDSTLIEQLKTRVAALESELDKIREAAGIDIQNLQADLMGKNREIGRLKAEIVREDEGADEHDDARKLLLEWKTLTGRNAKCDIGTGGKRYKLAKAAVKRWGYERSQHAIRGLALKPYSGPRGRSETQYLGSEKFADVEHALGDEVRQSRCEELWLAHLAPTLLEQPAEPESTERAFVRFAYGEDCELPYVPASKEPKQRVRVSQTAPIDRVLPALHAQGCKVVAHDGQPDSWSAQCPAHEDRSPSLSVHRKHDGMLLVHCFAGCDTEDVVNALGLEMRDLWDGSERDLNRADGPADPKRIPGHLRHAMRDLLALDERDAA